jgi:hypothetical protein
MTAAVKSNTQGGTDRHDGTRIAGSQTRSDVMADAEWEGSIDLREALGSGDLRSIEQLRVELAHDRVA